MSYKVWIQVEYCEPAKDRYADIGEPIDVADVRTEKQAQAIMDKLVEIAEILQR